MKFPALCSVVYVASFATVSLLVGQSPPPTTAILSATESLILERVNAGRVTVLSKEDGRPDSETVTIRASFLRGLLAGTLPGLRRTRNGVLIRGAVIEDVLNLVNGRVTCDVELVDCEFKKGVEFGRTSFEETLSFGRSTFGDHASFTGVTITGDATFSDAVFSSADFGNIRVIGKGHFRNTIFNGNVTFGRAEFGTLIMSGANFNSPKGASFNPLKVHGDVFFDKAIVKGPFDCSGEIAGDFQADGAEFQSLCLINVKCNSRGSFKGATFLGPVSFEDSTFGELDISGVNPKHGAAAPRIFISRIIVRGLFRLRDMTLENLIARSVRIEGPAELTGLQIKRHADLSYSHFSTLDLSDSTWPSDRSEFYLRGVKYEFLSAGPTNQVESHKRLLAVVQQSAFSADAYKNLETFFLDQGYREDANRAFIAGKRRERSEYLSGVDWFGSLLLDWLIGYGRNPERTGYLCLSIVALGCLLFPSSKMELQDPKELEKPPEMQSQYNRFWYSLGLFLPVVDLKTSELWKPQKPRWVLRNYVRVHILLGWILVPIFLAGLTGLIK